MSRREPQMGKALVAASYDQIAEQYLARRTAASAGTLAALAPLAALLPAGATVLDLGCGAGVPHTQWLARRFTVTGVDFSGTQIALARQQAPAATLIQADMTAVAFPPTTFDGVVACYSIIHLPRAEQPALVARIYDWLTPGGVFLANWATTAWEGEEHDWLGTGATMWWSHYDRETNLAMLRGAGFRLEPAETRTDGDERWLWICAHKPSKTRSHVGTPGAASDNAASPGRSR